MPTTRPDWHETNERLSYPLVDAGDAPPTDVLLDLSFSWDGSTAGVAYLGALTVTDRRVVGLTICDQLGNPIFGYSGTPAPYKPVRLFPLTPGGRGEVTFGPGVQNHVVDVRPGLAELAIHPNCYLPWTAGVRGFRANTSIVAGGVVRFFAGDPLEIENEETRIVLSPADIARMGGFNAACGKRSESNTCGDPAPALRLSGVTPNADGEITILLAGAITAHPLGDNTIVFSSSVALTTHCGG